MNTASTTCEAGHYSEYQAMQSAAGWYVGTYWIDPDGFTSPGSRDSPYFASKKEADAYLSILLDD